MLRGGQTLAPFRDYLDFNLTHTELKELFNHEDANREWRSRLSAVEGVLSHLGCHNGEAVRGICLRCKRHLGQMGPVCPQWSRRQQDA